MFEPSHEPTYHHPRAIDPPPHAQAQRAHPSSPLVLVRLRAPQRVDGAASVVVGAKDETEAEMATALPQFLQLGLHVRRQVNRRRHWAGRCQFLQKKLIYLIGFINQFLKKDSKG